jgi:hypothetical protein
MFVLFDVGTAEHEVLRRSWAPACLFSASLQQTPDSNAVLQADNFSRSDT